MNTGDPTNRYFTNISWAPDGKSLYLIELNRDQNHAKLCRYNSETGELMSTLIEETHPKYVEPQHPILFLPWDHTQFIYQSQKDGYNHLYLYNTDGKLIKQLTKGEWLIQNILGFNARKKEVIIASTEVSPLQSNLYKVNVNTGKRTPLTTARSTQRNTFRFGQLYYRPVFNSGYSPQNRDNQYPKQEKCLFAHCEESL